MFNRVGIAPRNATVVTKSRGPMGTRLNKAFTLIADFSIFRF